MFCFLKIKKHALPSVILSITLKNDLLNTLLSIFQFETERIWFVQYLRSLNKVRD